MSEQARAPFYAEGKYLCHVEEQALGVASTGNSQIIIKFKVIGAYQNGQPNELENQYSRTYYGTVTENTIEYLMNDLNTLGLYVTSFGQIDQNQPNFVSIIGNAVDMVCAHEKDRDGNLRERWRVAYSGGSKPLEYKAADKAAVSKLDALFGAKLQQGLAGKTAKPATVSVAPPLITNDDVPF